MAAVTAVSILFSDLALYAYKAISREQLYYCSHQTTTLKETHFFVTVNL